MFNDWDVVHTPNSGNPEECKPFMITIPEGVITTIALHSTKPQELITALILLIYEKYHNPCYYGGRGTPSSAICRLRSKFKPSQLKRAHNRLVELGILKKEKKELLIPWLEEKK